MSRLRNIGSFESEWQGAFQNASVQPPQRVWDRVEVALDAPAGGMSSKKGLLVIQLLVAASVAFALGVTSIGYYYANQNTGEIEMISSNEDIVSEDAGITNETSDSPTSADQNFNEGSLTKDPGTIVTNEADDGTITDDEFIAGKDDGEQTAAELALIKEDEGTEEVVLSAEELDPVYAAISVDFEDPEVRPIASLLGSSRRSLDTWTGMAMGTGSYNPNSSGSVLGGINLAQADAEASSAFDPNSISNGEESGTSYSVGVGAGFDLSPRWMLQGGLSYIRYSNSGYSNALDPATGRLLLRQQSYNGATALSSTLNVRSDANYISVPVQVGYYLVNRKFTWSLSTGVATDVFLSNRVEASNGTFSDTQKIGSESDYRSAYFNLLLGTELGYTIQQNYRFSVFPAFRHGITPMYKSETGASNLPYSMNLGFRFVYIFR